MYTHCIYCFRLQRIYSVYARVRIYSTGTYMVIHVHISYDTCTLTVFTRRSHGQARACPEAHDDIKGRSVERTRTPGG